MVNVQILKDFRKFIERGSAIDMAVGIIVGSVMTSVVNSLVKDIIMPPIGLLMGGIDFSQFFVVLSGGAEGVKYPTVEAAQAAGAATMNIGLFLNSVVSFLITMFAVFMIVRTVAKMRSKQPVTTRACPYCTSTISMAATKCPNCCSSVKPIKVENIDTTSDLGKSLHKISAFAKKKIITKTKQITKK